MRWSEIRRYPRGEDTVRLLRRETLIAAPKAEYFFIPRKRWRVVVQEATSAHVLLETREEAEAWATYWRESGDER